MLCSDSVLQPLAESGKKEVCCRYLLLLSTRRTCVKRGIRETSEEGGRSHCFIIPRRLITWASYRSHGVDAAKVLKQKIWEMLIQSTLTDHIMSVNVD